MAGAPEVPFVPKEPLGRLLRRFLRFGLLAWGGPVAQIAMIRQELVEEERWVSRDRFNRILGVYQALPGPEAHELCVYFGMLSRGRIGGFLAGLGFMLPGFLLMFMLSALYVRGVHAPLFKAFFLGVQPAVAALVVRAVHRIGTHALTDRWLYGIALLAAGAQLVGAPFWVTLGSAGVAYLAVARGRRVLAGMALIAVLGSLVLLGRVSISAHRVTVAPGIWKQAQYGDGTEVTSSNGGIPRHISQGRLVLAGLRAGLLTFGGAYTVLPFLQRDAVMLGGWMTNTQFLDGVALSGILPAPFIIFSTFVGYLGGGAVGALLLTVAIFLPAFGFTLIGHGYVERLVESPRVHAFLDGLTAGVVGLIGVTAVLLGAVALRNLPSLALFLLALMALYRLKARTSVVVVVLTAGILGVMLFRR